MMISQGSRNEVRLEIILCCMSSSAFKTYLKKMISKRHNTLQRLRTPTIASAQVYWYGFEKRKCIRSKRATHLSVGDRAVLFRRNGQVQAHRLSEIELVKAWRRAVIVARLTGDEDVGEDDHALGHDAQREHKKHCPLIPSDLADQAHQIVEVDFFFPRRR